MISVSFFTGGSDAARLCGFVSSGHTGIQGKSVLCAAVSSACYMAVNTLTDVLMLCPDVTLRDGYMRVALREEDTEAARVVLEGLRIHLAQLAEQYPKQIKISFSEVQHSC